MIHRIQRALLLFSCVTPLALSCGGGGGGGGSGPEVDPLASSVVANAPFGTEADGLSSVTITVTLIDDQGLPLAGREVTLATAGVGGTLVQPGAETDANGVTTGSLTALVAGPQTITASVGSVALDQEPQVTFIRNPPHARYVRASGSDASSGTSPLQAWATLGFALTQLVPGDTLYVGAGTYVGGVDITQSGTAAAPIELFGDTAGVYTGDAGAVVVDAALGAFGFRLSGVSHVVLRGFTVRAARPGALVDGGGIHVAGGADLYLVDNDVWGNDRGIDLQGAQRVHLEGNRVSNNDGALGDGIRLEQTADVRIENGLVYNNARYGLLLDAAATTTVKSSTFFQNGGDQVHEEGPGSSGTIQDSLLADGLATGIQLVSGTSISQTFNLIWNHTPDVQEGMVPQPPPPGGSADPELVLPAGADGLLGGATAADDDFRLMASSPALDVGSSDARLLRFLFGGTLRGTSTRTDGTLDGEGVDGSLVNLGAHRRAATDAFTALSPGEARLLHVSGDEVRAGARTRVGNTWSTARHGAPWNEDVRWVVQRVSPGTSAEEFLAALSDEGTGTTLYLRHFDGRLWSEDHPLRAPASQIPSANAGQRGFDLELEQTSGEALFVYADDDASPLFRTFSGGEWSADQEVFSTLPSAGTVLWVELVARPGTDEIALVTLDDDETLSALIWDGSAWIDAGVPMVLDTNSAELRDSKPFDAAYESLSGDLFVGWGYTVIIDQTRYMERDGATGLWSAQQNHNSTGANGSVYRLAADPTSDRIVAAIGEGLNGTDVSGMIWDGSTWIDIAGELVTNVLQSDPTYGVADQLDLAVGWLGTTGRAVLIMDRNGFDGMLSWANWNPAATQGFGWNNLIYEPAPIPVSGMGTVAFTELRSVPGANQLLALVVDDAGELFTLRFNGSQWSVEGGGAVVSEVPLAGAAEPFDLSFRQ